MSHTRVAVVQLEFHPAGVIHRQSLLEDPLFDLHAPPSLVPADGLPDALHEPFEALRARVRREHGRIVMLKLGAVLERCRAWGVQLVLLPEYAVAGELLPALAQLAPELVLVAGTHAVEHEHVHAGIYEQLGWPTPPQPGMAVAPVLYGGRLLGLQPKLSEAAPERGSLVLGDRWAPIELERGGGPDIPGPLGVMICLDFLYRERPEYRQQIGPELDRARCLAVPSYTPWHSAGEFAAEAWQEARRYGRPVLWANVAGQGGSSIFVDEGKVEDLRPFPARVGLLERGDEGVIVADVDLGFRRAGSSTRYGDQQVVRPVAIASLMYRHHPIGDRYAAWVSRFASEVEHMGVTAGIAAIEAVRGQLREAAQLPLGQARARRLQKLLSEAKRITQIEELRQFTREIVLPGDALPLDVLRKVWARECAELVFEWMRAHRGHGLEAIEARLREGGKLRVEPEQWTDAGRAALERTAAAIREDVVASHESIVVPPPVRVPVSVPLVALELEREGVKLVFRATPGELRRLDEREHELRTAELRSAEPARSRWPASALDAAQRLWLLERARGRLDAVVVGVEVEGLASVLVCVCEGERRVLLAASWALPALLSHAEAIVRAAAGYCDELRHIGNNEYYAEREALLQRFAGARQPIAAAVDLRLRELHGAFADVMARVDEHPPAPALELLDAWLDQPEQVMLVSGAFGTGKSTLVAKWCERRWASDDAGARPILVDLVASRQRDPIDALVQAAGRDPASLPDRAALSLLLLEGRVIACFDGFDEMVTRLAFRDVPERLAALLRVVEDGGKVLVTSRDHYFSSADAIERDLEQATARARTRGRVHARLQPFGDAQVDAVIDHFIPAEHRAAVRDKLRSTYDLQDLVQTPMLLSMVLQTIDELAPDARVGSASVYERYLDTFLDHANVGDPELFTPAQKRAFAEVLAAELWRSGARSLGWKDLHKSVMASLYDVLPDAPPEAALLEIQNGTFLVREDDRFRFAHKSFLEFFMAKGLLAGLERSPERVLDTAVLTPEVAAFVAELLRARGTGKADPAIQSLLGWLVGGRSGRVEPSARAAANALRLLRDVARALGEQHGWLPERADLRGIDLRGESLDELHMQGARVGRAVLVDCSFRGTDLRGASLQDSDLRDAHLWATVLDDVDLSRADLTGVEGHACSLARTKLHFTKLSASTWTQCDWSRAELEGVTVGPTLVDDFGSGASELRSLLRGVRGVLGGGHFNWVTSVDWSPDGRRVASTSYDKTIRIWGADEVRPLAILRGHSWQVTSVAWSPDGRRLASASQDGTIHIWLADEGCCLSTLQGHSVSSVDWSPDGRRIASASPDGTIRIWLADDGCAVSTLQGHSSPVSSVEWSPDGRRIASASYDNTVRIWLADEGRSLSVLNGHSDIVTSVAWSPDARRIASASADDTVRIWLADEGRSLATLQGHSSIVTSVAWSPDGRRIASASVDCTIRLWLADVGRVVSILRHSSTVTSAAWSPDGRRIASASSDNTIRIWIADDGSAFATRKGRSSPATSVAWSPDGCHIASASSDNTIRIWLADEGRALSLQGHSSPVTSVAWSPDGRRIASASYADTIRIWLADDGRALSSFDDYSSPVTSVAWSPDGRRIASGCYDDTIRIWIANQGRVLSTLKGHSGPVASVAWSPDGRRIASASYDSTIRIWLADEGRSFSTLEGHSDLVNSVAWSPDGRRIASASSDHTVRIWLADERRFLSTLQGHSESVSSVAWSPDSCRIASASVDGTIRIWLADEGRSLSILRGHSEPVGTVAWSPDGRRIASASHDDTVRIWLADPPSSVLNAHDDEPTAIAFAPDGAHFVSVGHDHAIHSWDARTLTHTATARHDAPIFAVAHAPTTPQIAIGSADSRIRILDAATLDVSNTLHAHTRTVTTLAYSPDGTLLASGSADRSILLWDPRTVQPGQYLAKVQHGHWVNVVAFSPDGTKLASGSSDRSIRVWSVPRLSTHIALDGAHTHYVNGIAWYPGSDRFVSSSWDGTLIVWDAHEGRRIHEIHAHGQPVRGLAFAPDGTRFASVSDDCNLKIWDADTFELREHFIAEHRLRRVAWSPDSTRIIAGTANAHVCTWLLDPCLAIFEARGEASLVRTPGGQFCLQPESAEAYLEVPRSDGAAVFYLPLAGIREHQSREAMRQALAGQPIRSLAQVLGMAPLPWDGEVRTISRPRPRPALRALPRAIADIVTNPFSPDTALNGDTLPGRQLEIDKIVQVLRRRGGAWLRGPRRAGKTSLLRYVAKHLPTHTFLSVSLQAGPIQTPDDIAGLLVPELRRSPTPAAELREHLRSLEQPVILLDEAAMLARVELGTLHWLRAIGQDLASIVYSGSHHDWAQVKQHTVREPGSSFGNDVTFIDFGPLPEVEAIAFLLETAPERAPISRTLADWVIEACGTWPFYLQVLGYALVERQIVHQAGELSRHEFRDLYKRVLLHDKEHYFELRWHELPSAARRIVLRELAKAIGSGRAELAAWNELARADMRVLQDAGAGTRSGWGLDKPLLDWMFDNYAELAARAGDDDV